MTSNRILNKFVVANTILLALLACSTSAQQYPCVNPIPPQKTCLTISPQGWVVGEIKTIAFGEDAKSRIVLELANSGWVEAAGQSFSRDDFPRLYQAIGDTWGSADGKNVFFLPDLRGQFLRGWNHADSQPQKPAFGGDPEAKLRTPARADFSAGGNGGHGGDSVGSIQPNVMQSHAHTIKDYQPGPLKSERGNGTYALIGTGDSSTQSSPMPTDAAPAKETRPQNAYVMYVIYVGVATNFNDATKRLVKKAP